MIRSSLCKYTTKYLSILLSMDILVIVNSATINIPGHIVQISFGSMCRHEILGSRVWSPLPECSEVAVLFYILTSSVEEFQLLHILVNTWY